MQQKGSQYANQQQEKKYMTQVQQFRETSASAKPNSASHPLIEKQSSHREESQRVMY